MEKVMEERVFELGDGSRQVVFNVNQLSKDVLYCTSDYDVFTVNPINREIKCTDKLEDSMRDGFISALPLHCHRDNGKLLIIGGHHRIKVARVLKKKVWFVISDDSMKPGDAEQIEQKWTIKNYAQAYAKANNQNYQILMKMHEDSGLPILICASLLGGESATSGNQQDKIRNGTFKVKDQAFANVVEEMVRWLHDNGVAFARNARFVGALSKVMQIPEFDTQQFQRRVKADLRNMTLCSTEKQFIADINFVYNKRSPLANRINLSDMVAKLMGSKQLPFKKK